MRYKYTAVQPHEIRKPRIKREINREVAVLTRSGNNNRNRRPDGKFPEGSYKLKKEKKTSPVLKLFMIAAAIAGACYCAFSIISDRADIAEKQAILRQLYQQEEELRAENAGYESIIGEEDERAYMERIATEVLGYAYPSERRFYDTTRS